jgi:hypothetical protein
MVVGAFAVSDPSRTTRHPSHEEGAIVVTTIAP